jgi:YVTN family beta-propeller protein
MKRLIIFPVFFLSVLYLHAQVSNNHNIKNSADTYKLPYNRMVKPAGIQLYFGDSLLENHALDASLSPDRRWLAVEERYSVVFINTEQNSIGFILHFKDTKELAKAMSTYSGICWYTVGGENYVYWSAAETKSKRSYVVAAKWDETNARITKVFEYKPQSPSSMALPNELLIRKESGIDYIYVVLNGNNQLIKQDLLTGDTIWVQNTGVAPYGIAFANGKIYVTNWGGRVPLKGDKNVAGVPWGLARIDTTNGATREGSVSIYDPLKGILLKETVVKLHPNEIVASPDEKYIYLTNSNSDMVSVINTATDETSEVISIRLQEDFNPFFGDSPNGLGISDNGKTLYVTNGMDNAIAVINLGNKSSSKGSSEKSTVSGFIPTAAYPSSVCVTNKRLYVTNLEAIGAVLPVKNPVNHKSAFNAHHMLASVSIIDIPGKKQLKSYTNTVIAMNQLERLKTAQLTPRENVSPKPLPERIGEPSVFKHVLYIIKENRTYDQVLGDVPQGKGDSSLCIYGKQVTPNTHKLVQDYTLLDNFMASGKCSAEGHQWTDASIVTDYIEKNVRAWFRSYPHVQRDALVYAQTGFLWDNARRNGINVRIYGEAATPEFSDTLSWSSIYNGFLKGDKFHFKNSTTINTVRDILSPTYPGYDGHKIPDALRADAFIGELKNYESMDGDQWPQLMIMALPNDHTGGTRFGLPTPRAMVADNDLALGRIIEAVTHSKFWKNTVIFVVEDDSQDGWDHVSSYRTVAMVISPYSKLPVTDHIPYNQPSIVRTIEQILGMPPMNIQDAIASPMYSCFMEKPDFAPFTSVKNQIPLNEMNPPASALKGKALHYAKLSSEPQFDGIDSGNDDLFNRILWFAAKGAFPYPGEYSDQ